MPFQVGPAELIVVLVVALIVLGPKKLPEVGRSLGKGIRGFKESISGDEEPRDATITAPKSSAPPFKTPGEGQSTEVEEPNQPARRLSRPPSA